MSTTKSASLFTGQYESENLNKYSQRLSKYKEENEQLRQMLSVNSFDYTKLCKKERNYLLKNNDYFNTKTESSEIVTTK